MHDQELKIRIAAPALDNKANLAVRRFIAQALAVPPGSVSVRRGAASRHKTLEIRDAGPEHEARARALAGSVMAKPG